LEIRVDSSPGASSSGISALLNNDAKNLPKITPAFTIRAWSGKHRTRPHVSHHTKTRQWVSLQRIDLQRINLLRVDLLGGTRLPIPLRGVTLLWVRVTLLWVKLLLR